MCSIKEIRMQNYIKLRRFSLFYYHYIFADTEDYLADNLFIQNKVRVHFGKEYKSPDSKYIFIFCKVKKSGNDKFLKALDKLGKKMLLMGNIDYQDFCEYMQNNIFK